MRCQFFIFILAVHSSNYCKQFYFNFCLLKTLGYEALVRTWVENFCFCLLVTARFAANRNIFCFNVFNTLMCAHELYIFLGKNFLYSSVLYKTAVFPILLHGTENCACSPPPLLLMLLSIYLFLLVLFFFVYLYHEVNCFVQLLIIIRK